MIPNAKDTISGVISRKYVYIYRCIYIYTYIYIYTHTHGLCVGRQVVFFPSFFGVRNTLVLDSSQLCVDNSSMTPTKLVIPSCSLSLEMNATEYDSMTPFTLDFRFLSLAIS